MEELLDRMHELESRQVTLTEENNSFKQECDVLRAMIRTNEAKVDHNEEKVKQSAGT